MTLHGNKKKQCKNLLFWKIMLIRWRNFSKTISGCKQFVNLIKDENAR